jgi:glucose dehydrogenase
MRPANPVSSTYDPLARSPLHFPTTCAAAAAALVICMLALGSARASDTPANVDAARLNKADRDAANWLSYGRNYREQRFSSLKAADNAKQLGFAWFADPMQSRPAAAPWSSTV